MICFQNHMKTWKKSLFLTISFIKNYYFLSTIQVYVQKPEEIIVNGAFFLYKRIKVSLHLL